MISDIKPIESAPRDGTEILIWREDCGWLLARWIAPCDFLHERELELEKIKDADEPDWFVADFISGSRLEGGSPTRWASLELGEDENLLWQQIAQRDEEYGRLSKERDEWRKAAEQMSEAIIMAIGFVAATGSRSVTYRTLTTANAEFERLKKGDR